MGLIGIVFMVAFIRGAFFSRLKMRPCSKGFLRVYAPLQMRGLFPEATMQAHFSGLNFGGQFGDVKGRKK